MVSEAIFMLLDGTLIIDGNHVCMLYLVLFVPDSHASIAVESIELLVCLQSCQLEYSLHHL